MRNYLLGIGIVVRGAALVKIKDSQPTKKRKHNTVRDIIRNKIALLVVVQRKCNEYLSIERSLNKTIANPVSVSIYSYS